MHEMIETIDLSKDFRDFWGRIKAKALDKLNLKIYRGEIFGLLGPNGSGKTTTLKLLLGLLFPTSGKIKILGGSPRNVENKKYIGFLPEESYLYPYQNAEEALFFYGRLFGFSRATCNKRVDDLLEMVGLLKARKRPLKEYSKGMARRIGIAQALINDPELVFLDEPTTGLDPIGTREIKDLILQLKKHGKTVFLCSHLLADVEDICDRIAILYGGKIRCEGAVEELLSKESVTQLSFENIPEKSLHEILGWLDQKQIKASVGKPKERLESFFLRIIAEARTQQVVTSGAEAGKTLENFFSHAPVSPSTPQNKIIEQLLATPKESEVVPSTSEVEAPTPQESIVIQTLLKQETLLKTEEKMPKSETSAPLPPKKDILEQLLPPSQRNKGAPDC
jgi:ABC-2 type transport system ATP-binding protein